MIETHLATTLCELLLQLDDDSVQAVTACARAG